MKYIISPTKRVATDYSPESKWVHSIYQLQGLRGIDLTVLGDGISETSPQCGKPGGGPLYPIEETLLDELTNTHATDLLGQVDLVAA